MGYVAQRSAADPGFPMRVRDLVDLGRLAVLGPWRRRRSADREAVGSAIERMGLGGLERRPLSSLSGGQLQRAHLARALAQGADVMVLDEPFTGVDAATVDVVVDVLRERAAAGVAVLVVVHDAAITARLCDDIAHIEAGHVTATHTCRPLARSVPHVPAVVAGHGW